VLDNELAELHQNGVQLRHLGDATPLSPAIQRKIKAAMALTQDNDQLILNIAFNYGGRHEIIQAVKAIVRDGVPADQINERLLGDYLYTSHAPDPDLIIRTSGEFRTSNFLLWQAAYAEYYVTPTYWPDFDKAEYWRALQTYSQRERRFGAVKQ
jgi:undecaprenyl diphosphate synthase